MTQSKVDREEFVRRVQFIADLKRRWLYNKTWEIELSKKWKCKREHVRKLAGEAGRVAAGWYDGDGGPEAREERKQALVNFVINLMHRATNEGNPTKTTVVKTTTTIDETGKPITTQTQTTYEKVNPAFQAGVSAAELAAKLEGFFAPTKSELTGKDGGPIKMEGASPADLGAKARKLVAETFRSGDMTAPVEAVQEDPQQDN